MIIMDGVVLSGTMVVLIIKLLVRYFNFGMSMMVILLEVQHIQIALHLHHGKDLD